MKYKAVQYRDAVVVYECEVEADTPKEALVKLKTQDQVWVQIEEHDQDHADVSLFDGEVEVLNEELF